ncbi:MAG: DUF86 domain-containing protein [Deltaproteobacteria bacterium]|jgi:uncharacterized protein YutE (UPF0331/DUF86 family)|nr:DUF86 domain-containing protein [Deltaproteobacteria bacterium]
MTPVQRDQELVRRHLAALDGAVVQLRRHTGQPVALLAANLDERWAVERGLLVCAQNCIDIATHLAASAGHDLRDYASAIDSLVPMGILDPDFAARFRAVAGFRNLLVHGYLEVDLSRVHGLLNERLGDFAWFADRIRAALDKG